MPMQLFVPYRKHRSFHIVSALALSITLATTSSSAAAQPASPQAATRDSIVVQKKVTSKKHKVKLFPNAKHEALFFNAEGVEGRVYQFYLFNVEGKLVKQANIKNNQTTIVRNLEKGNYLFEVFSDDERIENGQVIVL
ncbi:T9SS type A sorting domain-containing protein [Pseudobacter ginsenosidimutans]|nr:T9SS type A sorting domain-containing protein [Pseudobacter ginsenosidimutans]